MSWSAKKSLFACLNRLKPSRHRDFRNRHHHIISTTLNAINIAIPDNCTSWLCPGPATVKCSNGSAWMVPHSLTYCLLLRYSKWWTGFYPYPVTAWSGHLLALLWVHVLEPCFPDSDPIHAQSQCIYTPREYLCFTELENHFTYTLTKE